MGYYALHTKFIVKESSRDEFADVLLKAAKILEENDDCVYYLISLSSNLSEVYVAEAWSSRGAAEASLQNNEIKRLIGQVMPLMTGQPEKLSETEIVGGKGFAVK